MLIEGQLSGQDYRIAVIVARFNSFLTEALKNGAADTLRRHGVHPEQVDVIYVPGAYEMPLALKRVAQCGRYDGAVCLGAVIRGETPHFDYVAAENAKGIQSVMLQHDFPVTNGVLTTNTLEQAVERSGVKAGNKGGEAAVALIELISVTQRILQGEEA